MLTHLEGVMFFGRRDCGEALSCTEALPRSPSMFRKERGRIDKVQKVLGRRPVGLLAHIAAPFEHNTRAYTD